jgi:hypothetical protein
VKTEPDLHAAKIRTGADKEIEQNRALEREGREKKNCTGRHNEKINETLATTQQRNRTRRKIERTSGYDETWTALSLSLSDVHLKSDLRCLMIHIASVETMTVCSPFSKSSLLPPVGDPRRLSVTLMLISHYLEAPGSCKTYQHALSPSRLPVLLVFSPALGLT